MSPKNCSEIDLFQVAGVQTFCQHHFLGLQEVWIKSVRSRLRMGQAAADLVPAGLVHSSRLLPGPGLSIRAVCISSVLLPSVQRRLTLLMLLLAALLFNAGTGGSDSILSAHVGDLAFGGSVSQPFGSTALNSLGLAGCQQMAQS